MRVVACKDSDMYEFESERSVEDLLAKYLNDLVEIAVEHGGDPGGPYCICPEKLYKVMNVVARYINIRDWRRRW